MKFQPIFYILLPKWMKSCQ